jgi:hypothetical protein
MRAMELRVYQPQCVLRPVVGQLAEDRVQPLGDDSIALFPHQAVNQH